MVGGDALHDATHGADDFLARGGGEFFPLHHQFLEGGLAAGVGRALEGYDLLVRAAELGPVCDGLGVDGATCAVVRLLTGLPALTKKMKASFAMGVKCSVTPAAFAAASWA